MSEDKRALITGGTGFLGANLARELIRQGHEVELLVPEGFDDWRTKSIASDVKVTVSDFSDATGLRHLMQRAKPDWIFHLAVSGSPNLLQAARDTGFEAFINTGSPASIGQSEDLPMCTLRLCTVYGPFEEPTRFMPTLVINGLKGTLPPLADPSVVRDFVYVDDVVAACLAAARNAARFSGHVFDVGTGIQTAIREVVEVARTEFRIGPEPVWGLMPNRTRDDLLQVCDNRKTERALDWQPRTSLAQGVARLGRWLKFDPDRFEFYSEQAGA